MSTDTQGYQVRLQDDFIYLETWGVPEEGNVSAPVDAAIKLADEHHAHKLLDDIRRVDGDSISLMVQAKGLGVLWKLRRFKKVAIVLSGEEMSWMFTSSIQELRFGIERRIRGFQDVDSAVAWLAADGKKSSK
jgi:hypothetical protein